VSVPAGGSAPFSFKAHGPYFATAPAAGEAAPAGTLLTALRGKLTLNVAGRRVELDFAKAREVRLPQSPSVVMNQVDFARYSSDEAGGTFYVGVKNPNPFAIHLGSLTWAATIHGKPVGEGELGKGEQVAPASTGVFEVQLSVNQETYGTDVDKLIKTQTLPYELKGELVARMFKTPYELKGNIKLNMSK
jgi:LEA14-like dessication related protein